MSPTSYARKSQIFKTSFLNNDILESIYGTYCLYLRHQIYIILTALGLNVHQIFVFLDKIYNAIS